MPLRPVRRQSSLAVAEFPNIEPGGLQLAALSGGDKTRARRRALTLPALLVFTLLAAALSPVFLAIAVLVDLFTGPKRMASVRLFMLGTSYIARESIALFVITRLWVRHRHDMTSQEALAAHYELQAWWALGLRDLGSRYTRFRFSSAPIAGEGAFIVAARHESLADTIIPYSKVWPSLLPRYVLKKELRLDPGIDLVGQRLPVAFVDRTPDERGGELDQLADQVAKSPTPHDGIVIFPEGTFPTPARRARVLERLADTPFIEAASSLRHLLPPRPAGLFRLMDERPDAALVLLGHAGLHGCTSLKGIWRTIPFDDIVETRVWYIDPQDVPVDHHERSLWLLDRWLEMDRWIESVYRARSAGAQSA